MSLADSDGHRALDLRIDIGFVKVSDEQRAIMLAPILAKVLNTMRGWDQLAIELPEDLTDIFALEFCKAKVRLPLVRELIIGDNCGFVVDACPNVKEIKNWHGPDNRKSSDTIFSQWRWRHMTGLTLHEVSLDFVNALGRAPHLERFSKRDFWSPSLLDGWSSYYCISSDERADRM